MLTITLKRSSYFLIISGICILSACTHNDAETKNEKDTTAYEATTNTNENNITYTLPSPMQLISMAQRAGVPYSAHALPTKVELARYNGKIPQALALGAFTADLGYCVLNNQTQEAVNFTNTLRQIGSQLGISNVFEETGLEKRFEKNISNKDSLLELISELQLNTSSYLHDNSMEAVTVAAFTGALIESAYISTQAQKNNMQALGANIANQMGVLELLINTLKDYTSKDHSLTGLYIKMADLQSHYLKFESVKKANEENQPSATLNQDELNTLTSLITDFRTELMEGKF